jgi:hypothetical protein
LKKIVVVFTDGESDNKSEVQKEIKLLTNLGVVVCGVGITESGKPALTTYAPNAKIAEKINVPNRPTVVTNIRSPLYG